MTITAHKIGGPVGIGALLLTALPLRPPVLHGGGQERGVRSGTLDVAGAIAFAAAVDLATADLGARAAGFARPRDRLISGVEETIDGARLSGPRGDGRSPANAHFTFAGAKATRRSSASTPVGSRRRPVRPARPASPVPPTCSWRAEWTKMSPGRRRRFSLGHASTEDDVDAVLAVLPEVVEQARRAGMVSATPRWKQESA